MPEYSVAFPGSFAVVTVNLPEGEFCKAFSGSMISMSEGADLDVECEGGTCGAITRCCCPTGQAPLITVFKTKEGFGSSEVMLAPATPGDVAIIDNTHTWGEGWYLATGNYLASDKSVEVEIHLQGCLQCCFSGEGCFRLKTVGTGKVVISSFGSIVKYDVAEGETRIVDNGALVAWTANMDYDIGLAAGCCASLCSGEGFVCKFKGPGTVYIQTRMLSKLGKALGGLVAKQGGGGGDGGD